MLEAASGLWPFFFCDNIDGDVDGDGHGGDDDIIFVTRRTLKLSCNRLYWEKEKQKLHARLVLREREENNTNDIVIYMVIYDILVKRRKGKDC